MNHFLHLAEFIKGVELSGGTTPHVSMTVAAMERQEDPLEKLWFAGCYALTYNWPTAERIFLEWRPYEVEYDSFLSWSMQNWEGLPLRKERKAVYRKEAFAESACAYLNFAQVLARDDRWPFGYERAFRLFNDATRYMGRYIGIRWLEVMRRAFDTGWEMPDVRADGGEHPRKALALLYPEDAEVLLGGNSKREIAVTDLAAKRLLVDLELEYGLQTNYYELQSLLCEYKQSVIGKKQYPGKSIDTEMDYFDRVYDHWGPVKSVQSDFWEIRDEIFPDWSLGEKMGWTGVRKELGGVLVNHSYTWSDAIYDWGKTTDLADPVSRGKGVLLEGH